MKLKSILTQSKFWIALASVIPITMLAWLMTERYLGHDVYFNKTLSCFVTVAVALAGFWWWWAMFTIVRLTTFLEKTVNKFASLRKDIKEFKDDLK